MIPAAEVERYAEALASGASTAAEEVVRSLIHQGAGAIEIVDGLIGPGQVRIGELWENNELSVSAEHIATGVSAYLVGLVTELAPPSTSVGARILVASSPGEWHRLAVDMISRLSEGTGAEVVSSPGTSSAGQLIPVVHDEGPEIIVLSCAMPANLARAYSVVSVAREAHVPIIVGGRAFSLSPQRAETFGVALARSVGDLLHRLSTRDAWIPPAVADDAARRIGVIEPRMPDICDRLVGAIRTVPASGDPIADALWAVRALSSTVVCADPSILADQLTWQQRRHEVAGALSAHAIGAGLASAVAEATPSEMGTVEVAIASFEAETGRAQSS